MIGREILIVALAYIADNGYVSKSMSYESATGKRATSDVIKEFFTHTSKATPEEESKYGKRADEIIDWLIRYRGTDEFYLKCKSSFKLAQTNIAAAIPYICALPSIYDKISDSITLKNICNSNDPFLREAEENFNNLELKVFSVYFGSQYNTIKLLDASNRLYVSYIDLKHKIDLRNIVHDDMVLVSGKLIKRIPGNPNENRISIKKIIKRD